MGDSTKQNSFHIRLLTLPDHMHVINNMDVKMQIPLPSMQLWEVEDGPVVIEAPSADARIFMTENGAVWTHGKMKRCISALPPKADIGMHQLNVR